MEPRSRFLGKLFELLVAARHRRGSFPGFCNVRAKAPSPSRPLRVPAYKSVELLRLELG